MNDVEEFLQHHGVKGMKWGIRRFQPYGKGGPKGIFKGKKSKGSNRLKEAKKTKVSKVALTDEQRKARNAKIKKVLIVAGVVTLVAASAYLARNKWVKDRTDILLEKGMEMKNIGAVKDRDLNRHIYGSFKKSDKQKYAGILAGQLAGNKDDSKIYETTLALKDKIKIPSKKARVDEFVKLFESDKAFRESLDLNATLLGKFGEYSKMTGRDARTKAYDVFQSTLAIDDDNRNKYFKELAKKGYSAIVDENDVKTSGYKSKAPVILFDAAKSAVRVGQREVGVQEMVGSRRGAFATMARQILPNSENFKKDSKRTVERLLKAEQKVGKINKDYGINEFAVDHAAGFNAKSMEKINKLMDSGMKHVPAREKEFADFNRNNQIKGAALSVGQFGAAAGIVAATKKRKARQEEMLKKETANRPEVKLKYERDLVKQYRKDHPNSKLKDTEIIKNAKKG